jgi:hypothetical protein
MPLFTKVRKNPEKPMLPTFIPVDAKTLDHHPMYTEHQIEQANKIVAWYTLAAAATGALPVPAA